MDHLSNDYKSPFFSKKKFHMSVSNFLRRHPNDLETGLRSKFKFNYNCLTRLMETPDEVIKTMENGDTLLQIKTENASTYTKRPVVLKQKFSGSDQCGSVGA